MKDGGDSAVGSAGRSKTLLPITWGSPCTASTHLPLAREPLEAEWTPLKGQQSPLSRQMRSFIQERVRSEPGSDSTSVLSALCRGLPPTPRSQHRCRWEDMTFCHMSSGTATSARRPHTGDIIPAASSAGYFALHFLPFLTPRRFFWPFARTCWKVGFLKNVSPGRHPECTALSRLLSSQSPPSNVSNSGPMWQSAGVQLQGWSLKMGAGCTPILSLRAEATRLQVTGLNILGPVRTSPA